MHGSDCRFLYKDGKLYTALSIAYQRLATKSNTKSTPVCSVYGKMFAACNQFNSQIKNRIRPHWHGGRGHLARRGSSVCLPFGSMLQNTFNAYCVFIITIIIIEKAKTCSALSLRILSKQTGQYRPTEVIDMYHRRPKQVCWRYESKNKDH